MIAVPSVLVSVSVIPLLLLAAVLAAMERPRASVATIVAVCLVLLWLLTATFMPKVPREILYYEIVTVTIPDGSSCQLFAVDGVLHNATTQFHRTVDPERWHVKRTIWETRYNGIDYTGSIFTQDTYTLEEKHAGQ